MEIREGIKFKSIYASNIEFVLDKIEKNNLISRDNGEYKYTFEDVIANFKKDIWKLTYYPYKIGDWVKILDSIGPAFKITNEMGFDFESPPINIRPAFEDEIPKENIINKEELLAEAKRRYPIGTKIISAARPDLRQEVIIKQNKFLFKYTETNNNNIIGYTDYNTLISSEVSVYNYGKWAEIIENKTENMNELDKELKERESKLNKNVTNSDQVLTLNLIASEIFKPNNKIKPNLIKHNNSRFQKLLIIRTNKSKHSGKTK